jgi:putative ABC transport system permease protein
MSLPLSIRFAGRDLRGGLKGFRIFLACLTLGVTAIAGVGSLSSAIKAGITTNARALLGADVEVRVASRPASPEQVAWIRQRSDVTSLVRRMRVMARAGNGRDQTLIELKAVEDQGRDAYPLYGAIKLEPAMKIVDALAIRDGVSGAVAEATLFARLGVAVGDELSIGKSRVRLSAKIVAEPDRVAGTFSLGPRLIMSNRALDLTGLIQQGSLVRHNYRARLAPDTDVGAWTKDLNAAFPEAAWRVFDVDKAQPSVKRFIDRLGIFLTLVGLTALIIGGVGVGNAVQAYLSGKTETIATLKCLGADSNLIFRIYLVEIGGLAVLGIIVGLMLGAALPMVALTVLEGTLPVAADIAIFPEPLLRAAAFGALTALAFALWPLAVARDIPAAGLFRDIISAGRGWPRLRDGLAILIAGVTLIILALSSGDNVALARWFVLITAVVLFAFWLLGRLIVWLLRQLPRARHPGLRLAMTNLTRPGTPTAGIVISLGAGLTVLVIIALVEGNLDRQVQSRIPERAPSFFFIDIQPDQVATFDKVIASVPGSELVQRLPTLRGRVAMINGTSADEVPVEQDGAWFAHNEIGFTYLSEMPDQTELTAGTWWAGDYRGEALISLGDHIAGHYRLKPGDSVTFNILGRKITAKIANLRKIDWTQMRMNFAVIFSPGTLEGAPQVHIATTRTSPGMETTLRDAVTSALPNVSAIGVGDVLETITGMFNRIAAAIRSAAVVTLIAGILVLAGALAAGYRRRVYDAVIMKVLGATRRDVGTAYVIEYMILGVATAALAGVVGTAASWGVMTQFMAGEWIFLPVAAAITAGGGIVVTVALGFAGTWQALGQKAASVLRQA